MTEEELKILINSIAQHIYEKKGFNILALDVRGVSTLTDFFIIADGNVERHVKSLADSIVEYLREQGLRPFHVEGVGTADWVVLDYLDFVVHLFTPAMHDRFRLEEVWKEGKIIDVELQLPADSSKSMGSGH